jgi:hypothetical protein
MAHISICELAVLAGVISIATSSCSPLDPDEGSVSAAAFVEGRVTNQSGNPVPRASVSVRVYAERPCNNTNPGLFPTATTRVDGGFGIDLVRPFSNTFEACIVVVAVPPAGSPLSADSTSVPAVQFRTKEPYDTATADVVLGSASPGG